MSMAIRNWRRYQTGDYNPDWIRLPRDLCHDDEWKELSGDDAKYLITILSSGDEFGRIPDIEHFALIFGLPRRKTQQIFTNLKKWWTRSKKYPVKLPDETNYVKCARCEGKGWKPHPGDADIRIRCWRCGGIGTIEILKEKSKSRHLVHADTEQWYAWYHWFEKTNLFAVNEMDKARDDKRPYPVETEWPPEPKRRPNGGL